MATLKDLLRAETLAGGARGAALDVSTYVSFTPPAKNGSVDFVAPCDGAVHVNGEYNTKDTWNSIWSRINDTAQTGLALGGSTGWITYLTRVKKGDKVTVGTTGETSVSRTGFFKVIGGGHKRYLPTLSRNRFGGAPWLRLKTASETLEKQAADWRFRLLRGSLLKPSTREYRKESGVTCRRLPGTFLFGSQVRKRHAKSSGMPKCLPCQQTQLRSGGVAHCHASKGCTSSLRYTERLLTPEKRFSFLLSAASNNARMEVAA